MYVTYHGPEWPSAHWVRVHALTAVLARGLEQLGYTVNTGRFDTLTLPVARKRPISDVAANPASISAITITVTPKVSLMKQPSMADVEKLLSIYGAANGQLDVGALADAVSVEYPEAVGRTSDFLTHPVFNSYFSETEMMRYIKRLENRETCSELTNDPAGIMHDETECRRRDAQHHPARLRPDSSFRAAGSGPGLPETIG
ncbi:MAG: hypothetical protein R3C44_03220 [Chloroflexota bacterium]